MHMLGSDGAIAEELCNTPFPSAASHASSSCSRADSATRHKQDDTLPSPPAFTARHTTDRALEYSHVSSSSGASMISNREDGEKGGTDRDASEQVVEARENMIEQPNNAAPLAASTDDAPQPGVYRQRFRYDASAIRPVPAQSPAAGIALAPSGTTADSASPSLGQHMALVAHVENLEALVATLTAERDESDRQRRNMSILLERSTAYMEELKHTAAQERLLREQAEARQCSVKESNALLEEELRAIQEEIEGRCSRANTTSCKATNTAAREETAHAQQQQQQQHALLVQQHEQEMGERAKVAAEQHRYEMEEKNDLIVLLKEELEAAVDDAVKWKHAHDAVSLNLSAVTAEQHASDEQLLTVRRQLEMLSNECVSEKACVEELQSLMSAVAEVLGNHKFEKVITSECIMAHLLNRREDAGEKGQQPSSLSAATQAHMDVLNHSLQELCTQWYASLDAVRTDVLQTATAMEQRLAAAVECMQQRLERVTVSAQKACAAVCTASCTVAQRARDTQRDLRHELAEVHRRLKLTELEKDAADAQLEQLHRHCHLMDALSASTATLQDMRLKVSSVLHDAVEDVQQVAVVGTTQQGHTDTTFLSVIQAAALRAEAHVQLISERSARLCPRHTQCSTPPRHYDCGRQSSVPMTPRQRTIYNAMQRIIHNNHNSAEPVSPSLEEDLFLLHKTQTRNPADEEKQKVYAMHESLLDAAQTVAGPLANLCRLVENNKKNDESRERCVREVLTEWQQIINDMLESSVAQIGEHFSAVKDTKPVVYAPATHQQHESHPSSSEAIRRTTATHHHHLVHSRSTSPAAAAAAVAVGAAGHMGAMPRGITGTPSPSANAAAAATDVYPTATATATVSVDTEEARGCDGAGYTHIWRQSIAS